MESDYSRGASTGTRTTEPPFRSPTSPLSGRARKFHMRNQGRLRSARTMIALQFPNPELDGRVYSARVRKKRSNWKWTTEQLCACLVRTDFRGREGYVEGVHDACHFRGRVRASGLNGRTFEAGRGTWRVSMTLEWVTIQWRLYREGVCPGARRRGDVLCVWRTWQCGF